ncbi:ABC transporter ATP-binding protein [Streptomyces collinus]|uniref:ABC transporter ATP-binding protein n=1 Tax=Streptomyces collinus (strain DSM 40733 / Tue 365) TaxID=1214242 RepID=S5UR12_STRC3|nr:ABC transporter ATP-binding protein [Streptomyces collinus]AGS69498.1 ABC transporter ATP-binding protein [Streptomyces collinus Tu 365]UJA16996.1 ABC transporter ATP-binding protein [Streptomyces collinus]
MAEQHGPPAVVFEGVVKAYGDVRAVDGIDLTIHRGETVALLGPNGAGKSTTIGMLLGLFPPDEGTVEVFGKKPELAMRAGHLGAMLQEGKMIPRVSVRELVDFVRGTYRDPLPLQEVLELAELTAIADRKVDRLSGGQAQRVRFALALAGDPDLVVLDEPTAALDVESRRELWAAMQRYARRGNTVLFSTHYLEEADDSADRVIVIAAGRVVADGTTSQIKSMVEGRTVSFAPRGGPSDGYDLLPGVTAVEFHGGRVHLRTTDSDRTVHALARADAFTDLEVSGVGLEEAFIALTHRARHREAAPEGRSL